MHHLAQILAYAPLIFMLAGWTKRGLKHWKDGYERAEISDTA